METRADDRRLVLDRYRLHDRLGSGGMGTVWAARNELIDRDVAIKIEPGEDQQLTFEGSAKGDAFDRISLRGTVDCNSGVCLSVSPTTTRVVNTGRSSRNS